MQHSPSLVRPSLLKSVLIGGLLLPLVAASGLAAESRPANAVSILGSQMPRRAMLLAIDDYSLPLRKNLCYYLSKPKVRTEAVLGPTRDNPHATDTMAAHFYGTVLQDGGKFRMWYYGVGSRGTSDHLNSEKQPDILIEGPICYAESTDGLHWTKPNLGQVERNGGSDNNAIALPDSPTQGVFIIKDESDPDASRRYFEQTPYLSAEDRKQAATLFAPPSGS